MDKAYVASKGGVVFNKEPKKKMTMEERRAELERSRTSYATNERACTPQVKEAWNAVLIYATMGVPCPLCKGLGHTLFKCPAYINVKHAKDGISLIRPAYNALVSKEMIRIHEEALEKGDEEVGIDMQENI